MGNVIIIDEGLKLARIQKTIKLIANEYPNATIKIVTDDGSKYSRNHEMLTNGKIIVIDLGSTQLDNEQLLEIEQKAKVVVEKYYSSIMTLEEYYKVLKCVHGNFYLSVKSSLMIKEKLLEVIQFDCIDQIYLSNCKDPMRSLNLNFTFPKSVYASESLNYWGLAIAREYNLKIKGIDLGYRAKRNMKLILQKSLFALGLVKKGNGYRSTKANDVDENVSIHLLRGKAHVNLAKRVINAERSNVLFIYDSSRVTIDMIRGLSNKVQIETSKLNLLSVSQIISSLLHNCRNYTKYREIKNITVQHELNWKVVSPIVLFGIGLTEKILESFKMYKVDDFFTYEESNLFGALFSHSVNSICTRSACVQHGFFVNFDSTMPLISNERWVWGKYFKSQYELRGENSSQLVVKGDMLLDISGKKIVEMNRQNYNVLLAPASIKDSSEMIEWLHECLKSLTSQRVESIVVSLHPNQYKYEEIEKELLRFHPTIKLQRGVNNELIKDMDVVISGNTTVGFEAALLGKVVLFKSSHSDNQTYEYVKHPYILNMDDIDNVSIEYLEQVYQKNDELYDDFISQYVKSE